MSTATMAAPEETLRHERERYFKENGFGDDGGYGSRWVVVKVGPVPLAFPNTEARVRAVRYHDLHHILTGYATDLHGEAEIAAWELATGCRMFPAAWVLNLSALAIGVLIDPRAMFAAFVRGRSASNLYRERFDAALLESRVGELRHRLGLDRPPPTPTAADRRAFAGQVAAAALAAALGTGAVAAALAAIAYLLAR